MGARGVHFAITSSELARLQAASDDDEVMEVIEAIEERWDEANLAESDKAWDAIHRCLTDGSLLYEGGSYPLNHFICGGRQLHQGEDYTVALVMPEQVKDVAAAAAPLSEAWLRERYFSLLKPGDYDGEIGEDDFGYTWESFQDIRNLFAKAAKNGRAIIFTTDA
jgi:hypothetical protein